MNSKIKWAKKIYSVIIPTVLAIVAVIGIVFGKVVEATLFQEVAKWVVMAVIITLLVCGLAYPIIGILASRRDMLYPKYGKKWFIEDIKRIFRKK